MLLLSFEQPRSSVYRYIAVHAAKQCGTSDLFLLHNALVAGTGLKSQRLVDYGNAHALATMLLKSCKCAAGTPCWNS
jgi:hypothetical protein